MNRLVVNFLLLVFLLLFMSMKNNRTILNAQETIGQNDSLKIAQLKERITFFAGNKQWDSVRYTANKLILLGRSTNDTSCVIDGYYRLAYYEKKAFRPDEAYQVYLKGIELAIESKDSLKAAKMLLNVTTLQLEIGDFLGAQESAIKGIPFAKAHPKLKLTSELYRGLGNAFQNLTDYPNAMNSYESGLKLTTNNDLKTGILNNIGNCYRKQNKLQQAIEIYRQALSDSVSISTKATLLDNLGYTIVKTDPEKGISLMEESIIIRNDLVDNAGLIASNIHLAETYMIKDSEIAITYARTAYQLSKKIDAKDGEVEALSYLLRLQPNTGWATEYVRLNDSLIKARSQRLNKFAGIRFRTAEIENHITRLSEENEIERLTSEKNRIQKWYSIAGLSIVGVLTIFLYRRLLKEQKDKKVITNQKDKIEHQKRNIEKLQREIHHRLKNNLSFIDLFISLAKGKFSDKAYLEKLNELQSRISSMFEVHKQLYRKEDITTVNASSYISTLINSLKKTYLSKNITLDYNVSDSIQLDSNISFTIGLIINEFVTNSFKYAFPNEKAGIVHITLEEHKANYILQLKDNGIGLPEDFSLENLDSFGIDTIKLLVEECHGSLALTSTNGVEMQLQLSKNKPHET